MRSPPIPQLAVPAPARPRSPWLLAITFAVIASAAGILLTGISVWFLGAVALAGLGPSALVFNFHIPAAFVRLFALSKTVSKYGERVVGHRAALLDQVKRRANLFLAMAHAPATRAASWQFGNQDRLSDYMDDVEDVDYARLRVGIPTTVLLTATVSLTTATAWFAPVALLPIALMAIALGASLRRLAPLMARQWKSVRGSQRTAGLLLGSALASVVPLKAEHALPTVLSSAFGYFSKAEASRLAQRRALAALDMLAGLTGPLAAISVLVTAWYAGQRSNELLIPALLGFGWLALGEAANGVSRILLGRVREHAAREGLQQWSTAAGLKAGPSSLQIMLRELTLSSVLRQTPDGRLLGRPIDLTFLAGQPTILRGASGTGKTTLLKQIAGWVGADGDNKGLFIGDGVVMLSAYRRAMSHLCLHDAAILADTVRENLFAPAASDRECWLALTAVELDGRIAAAGGLNSWIGQETLSLGEAQRLNLARALLSNSPIVLLDEPVEHLDSDQASRILQRVFAQLADRIVIYASHADDVGLQTQRVSLGREEESADLRN